MKQLSLFPKLRPQFGGSLLSGKRKSKRPLTSKLPLHLIIKSEKARGPLSFVAHQQKILLLIQSIAKKHNVRIFDKAVNFNHLHLVLQLPTLNSYSPWIRELTSKIVALLQSRTTQSLTRFFEFRPFTRIVNWGRDLAGTMQYQTLNQLEVFGLRPAKKPKVKTKKSKPSIQTDAPP